MYPHEQEVLTQPTTIKDLKDLTSIQNVRILLGSVQNLWARMQVMEEQMARVHKSMGLKVVSNHPPKVLTQIGKFEPYIQEVLADGRPWSVHGIFEEIRKLHPDAPPFKVSGVQNSCNRLWHTNAIEKVATMTYRKKQA